MQTIGQVLILKMGRAKSLILKLVWPIKGKTVLSKIHILIYGSVPDSQVRVFFGEQVSLLSENSLITGHQQMLV